MSEAGAGTRRAIHALLQRRAHVRLLSLTFLLMCPHRSSELRTFLITHARGGHPDHSNYDIVWLILPGRVSCVG